jgi:hypothetical protein
MTTNQIAKFKKSLKQLLIQIEQMERQEKEPLRKAKRKPARPPSARVPKITQADYERYIASVAKPSA